MEGKLYNLKSKKHIPIPENITEFLRDIEKVCQFHNLSIAHEDNHGAFIIENFDENNIRWLKETMLNIEIAD